MARLDQPLVRRVLGGPVWVALSAALLAPTGARAEPPPAEPTPAGLLAPAPPRTATATAAALPTTSLALTISGGVSLGVYEAGFLYMLNEALKGRRALTPRLFTGASAGSANAFISALSSCSPPNPLPSEDLGWKTWIPLGYDQLVDETRVTPVSVFHRDQMHAAMLEAWKLWQAGLPESCDVVVGVSVTRVRAYSVPINDDFSVPRADEKFAIRIRGQGAGRFPRVTNYVDPYRPFAQPLLHLRPEHDAPEAARHNYDQIERLLFASAAFPFAFQPVEIPHCMLEPLPEGRTARPADLECLEPERRDLFIDGGVFDNNPMRLSNALSQAGLRHGPTGEVYWRDLTEPRAEDRADRDDTRIVYIDPGRYAYRLERPVADRRDTFLRLLAGVSGDLVDTARAKELYALVQESPGLSKRISLSMGQYPKASEPLGAFLGFFDAEFRRFDFYLGMYDAWVQIQRTLTDALLRFEDPTDSMESRFEREWKPLACMISWFDPEGHADLRPACDDPELRSFRVLLQASLDRLYGVCRSLESSAFDERHHHCARAAKGEAAPTVPGATPLAPEARRPKPDEDDFQHFMRLLDGSGFEFADLGLSARQSTYGRIKIRRRMLKLVDLLSDAQPDAADRTLLLTGGRQLVNTVAYEPPENWWYAMLGTSTELGASILPFDWNESWARLNLALNARDLVSILSGNDPRMRLSLAAGPELELLFITTPTFQPQVGFRAGYQFGTRDRFGARDCTGAVALDDPRNCSQFILQPYAALAIVERFRLQLLFDVYPQRFDFDSAPLDVQLLFGVQFF